MSLDKLTDNELFTKFTKEKNIEAYATLVERYHFMLRLFVNMIEATPHLFGAPQDTSFEKVQTVLKRLYECENLPRPEMEVSSFLFGAVFQLCDKKLDTGGIKLWD